MGILARVGAGVVAAATAAAVLLVTGGTASAHDGSGRSEANGTSPIAIFNWHVSRDSDGRAHGYFHGKAPYGGDILVSLEGPATCVDIEGNKVGFLYPVVDRSRPFFLKGQYILITGVDNGGGGRIEWASNPSCCRKDVTPASLPSR